MRKAQTSTAYLLLSTDWVLEVGVGWKNLESVKMSDVLSEDRRLKA